MQSDWHVGTGYGDAVADRAVRRDIDGLPYIPGKSLRGMLRDACEQVAYGLDEGPAGPWHRVLELVFGDQPSLRVDDPARPPRPGALYIGDARFEATTAAALKSKPRLAQAATFIKPGVKISPETGAAEPRCLRFEELARGGVVLEAPARLELPGGTPEPDRIAASALIVAGLTRLERLGGKRRRGSGRVSARVKGLADADREALIDRLLEPVDLHARTSSETETPPQPEAAPQRKDNSWTSVPFDLVTLAPVCVPRRTVGNTIETLDRIPGYHLLPVVAQALSPVGIDLRDVIASGDLIVTDACLVLDDGIPSAPAPRCLVVDKKTGDSDSTVHNIFGLAHVEQPRALTGWYAHVRPDRVLTARPVIQATTHNSIDDETQRPQGAGGLYTIEAIAAGTLLGFEVRMRQWLASALHEADPQWPSRLTGERLVGAAKSAEYGLCRIDLAEDGSRGRIGRPRLSAAAVVWLVSDTLIRDERLRPSTAPDDFARALGESLGVACRVRRAATAVTRIESWQRSWGLPRPTLIGFAAGSCFEVEFQPLPDGARIADVEAAGIGERRAEGFGQIRFDPELPASSAPLDRQAVVRRDGAEAQILPIGRSASLRAIETAAWREAIDARSAERAAQPGFREKALGLTKDAPPLSQVAALRDILGTVAGPDEGAAAALRWLDHLGEVANRAAKWDSGALSRTERFKRIRQLLEDENRVWELLAGDDGDAWLLEACSTEDVLPELKRENWAYAVRALGDACCRAHKRDQEKTKQRRGKGGA